LRELAAHDAVPGTAAANRVQNGAIRGLEMPVPDGHITSSRRILVIV
jgi:hypothetical protein